jgi:hypothetical protein
VRRLPGWPERLAEYLAGAAAAPFNWATHSCVHLAAGAVLAVTGVNVLEGLPQWHDEASAKAIIAGLGRSLPEAVDAVLSPHGVTRCDPQLSGRGDIALVQTGALGVHAGHAIAALGAGGLTWFAPSDAIITWKV